MRDPWIAFRLTEDTRNPAFDGRHKPTSYRLGSMQVFTAGTAFAVELSGPLGDFVIRKMFIEGPQLQVQDHAIQRALMNAPREWLPEVPPALTLALLGKSYEDLGRVMAAGWLSPAQVLGMFTEEGEETL